MAGIIRQRPLQSGHRSRPSMEQSNGHQHEFPPNGTEEQEQHFHLPITMPHDGSIALENDTQRTGIPRTNIGHTPIVAPNHFIVITVGG